MKPVADAWEQLAGRRLQFVEAFYRNLFERHPQYRQMFPASLDGQMERMVEMLGALVRFSDHVDLIRPYLADAAVMHRRLGIDATDLRNFTDTLLDTLAAECGENWNESEEAGWRKAVDDVLIPVFDAELFSASRVVPARPD